MAALDVLREHHDPNAGCSARIRLAATMPSVVKVGGIRMSVSTASGACAATASSRASGRRPPRRARRRRPRSAARQPHDARGSCRRREPPAAPCSGSVAAFTAPRGSATALPGQPALEQDVVPPGGRQPSGSPGPTRPAGNRPRSAGRVQARRPQGLPGLQAVQAQVAGVDQQLLDCRGPDATTALVGETVEPHRERSAASRPTAQVVENRDADGAAVVGDEGTRGSRRTDGRRPAPSPSDGSVRTSPAGSCRTARGGPARAGRAPACATAGAGSARPSPSRVRVRAEVDVEVRGDGHGHGRGPSGQAALARATTAVAW